MDSLGNFEFDWTHDPKRLRQVYKSSNFDSIFHKQIAKDVIATLSPQLVPEPHNLIYDDDLAYRRLIGPLERFICGLPENAPQEDVDNLLDHLKTLKQPSKMCRKVLKTGDVLFSCNDCGYDATCVVCIDCFHKSAHKDHNYRMSATDGGGCCDCGDVEAWKQYPACSDHQASDQPNMRLCDFEDKQLRTKQIENDKAGILEKISLLPDGFASRYFLVCQASLHYARTMLTWCDYTALPDYLDIEAYLSEDDDDEEINILKTLISNDNHFKNHFVVLSNDEVHTYDHVINTLVKIIKCNKMTASIMASAVSREGRSLILQDQLKPCKQVRDAIACVRDSGQGSLKVEVIHGSVLAHQAYALKLIEWIQRMSLLCDAFRVLAAYTLLGSFDPIPQQEQPEEDMTLLEKIARSNTDYWKQARIDWNDLFVTTLLSEYSIKDQFARLITRSYPVLVQDFIDDDHDHSVSVLALTTQLYTVPSLTCMLIEEEDALSVITQKLIDVCRSTKRETGSMNFENRNTFDLQSLKRGFYIISDIRHLINLEPTKWTDNLRQNVINAVKIFLTLLDSMQGMDSVKRQLGQHLEYEQEWETGMTLQSRMIPIISRLVKYCSLDETVLIETLRETQTKLLRSVHYKTVKRELFGYTAQCIQYDVSTSPVSVHLPLTRFAAALIVELMQRRPCNTIPYDESLVILTSHEDELRRRLEDEDAEPNSDFRNSMIHIMEPSLRTEVMIAQFRSGMWRRNGFSLVNQIIYFSGAMMRKEMFDRDILVLQECAATCEPNEFIIHFLNKFNLFTWVNSETTREPLVGPKAVSFYNDEEILTQTMTLGEEFLQLILTIISERYRVGVGKIEEEDVMKIELIQLLCIQPYTRSEITQKFHCNDNDIDCIKSVATLRRSGESSTGKYELKEEFYERFNPFFYHYNRRNQSHALDAQLRRKRNNKEPLICCPPPKPVELTYHFRNLNELLKCKVMLIIIQKILRRASSTFDPSKICSTKAPIRFDASHLQLDQCLHIIGLGLHEQERSPVEFNYLKAAQEMGIFGLLRDCYTTAKRSKDLILWLIRKASALISEIEMKHAATFGENDIQILTSIRQCFEPVLSSCDAVKQESKRNSELAAQRRERIMAMMKAKQSKFLNNPDIKLLAAETAKHEAPQTPLGAGTGGQSIYMPPANEPPTSSSSSPTAVSTERPRPADTAEPTSMDYESMDESAVPGASCRVNANSPTAQMTLSEDEEVDDEIDDKSDDGRSHKLKSQQEQQNNMKQFVGSSHLCILCRDEQIVGFDKPTMVLLAYVQRSAVLSKNRTERRIPNYSLTPSNQLKHLTFTQHDLKPVGSTPEKYSFTSDNSWSFDASFMPADLFFGPYISTCGHVMHYDCWKSFSDAVTKRETTRLNRGGRHISYELDKDEILCPLNQESRPSTVFNSKPSTIERSSENLTAFLHALKGTVATYRHVRHLTVGQPQQLQQSQQLVNHDDKYTRLMRPTTINDVLKDLDEGEALELRDFITSMRNDKISSSFCTKDLLSSIQTFAERIHAIGLDLDKTITDVHHARIFMMTTWSISYSIQAHERALRFKGFPLFEGLGSSKNLCLDSLVRFACTSMMTHQSDMIQSLLVQKLRYLLVGEEHLMASPCCLDIDALELFVSVFVMLQKLYSHTDNSRELNQTSGIKRDSAGANDPSVLSSSFKSTGSHTSTSSHASDTSSSHSNYAWATGAYDHEYYRNLLHLIVILNLLQVIITIQNDKFFERDEKEVDGSERESHVGDETLSNECVVLRNFYEDAIMASGHPISKLSLVNEQFVHRVKSALLPFLRSCAIFLYQLSHIEPSELLKTKSAFHEGKDFGELGGTDKKQLDTSDREIEEFDAICEYLNLPNEFSKMLRSQEARNLALSWLRHSRVHLLIKSSMLEAEQVKQRQMAMEESEREAVTKRAGSSSGAISRVASTSSIVMQQQQHQHQQLQSSNELMPLKFIRQPHLVNRLIDLPYDYSELVDKVKYFSCPSIKNEDSRTPTLCLVCGVMLCSQSYCCQRDLNDLASNYKQVVKRQEESRQQWLAANDPLAEGSSSGTGGGGAGTAAGHFPPGSALAAAADMHSSAIAAINRLFPRAPGSGAYQSPLNLPIDSRALLEENRNTFRSIFGSHIGQQLVGSCTYHAHECSGGVGVFLRVRNCQILLLSGRSKGCYMPAPYIDDHGETDFGLVRGAPLHLARSHYERLQQSWLNHTIPEQISRTLHNSSYASNINWHLH